ncbi:MAG: hypothetical protein ACRD0F_02320, partial [Acidimicrobiales bacterium]
DDTVTLALGGASVALGEFARALDRMNRALQQLASDAGARIDWVVAGLDYSSAIATVVGRPLDEASEALVPQVVDGFGAPGEAIAYDRPPTASPKTMALLRQITSVLGGGVDEVRFETATREAVVRAGEQLAGALAASEPSMDRGTVVGRVQTLQGRGRLRFTLYDLANDRAVSCWLSAGHEELMRGAWGRLVEVEGVVWRDATTNVPLSVRQVTDLNILPEPAPEAWLSARGAVVAPGSPAAEQVIRQLRDAW